MANPIGNSDTCGESDQSAGETHDGRFSGHEQCNQSVGSAECLHDGEVSAAIVFLLSDAAAFISGSCIRVDGAVPNARASVPMPDHDRSRPYYGFPLETPPEFLTERAEPSS